MPIGRRASFATGTATYVVNPNVVVPPGGLTAGIAVALVNEDGTQVYRSCGALPDDYSDCFLGFLSLDVSGGGVAKVAVGRGSLVQPLVEGGVPLIPNQDVYLSPTPGRVTQSNVNVPTMRRIKLGYAISTTQMVIVTDMRYMVAPG